MRTPLLMALIAFVLLFIFNPEMGAFRQFVRQHSEELLLEEAGDSALGRAMAGAGGALAGSFVDRVTERENYMLFSIYTIDLDGEDQRGAERRFLGIAGMFFELEPEDA